MSKHTPGPWRAVDDGDGEYSIWHDYTDDQGESYSTWLADGTTSQDDANLIAAAPDLLLVTQGFRRKLATYVSVYPGDKELRRLLDECDAAIAKATGGAA